MNEWLWLLLPVAAASGWLAASMKDREVKADRPGSNIPPEYLRGLGFLLAQQHDKATELFIDLFTVDSNTIETHLVLGNLFRQKGEVEKAIRIHQNIIARPQLSDYHQAQAMLELGRDYFSAGLLDRAEKFFNQVLSLKIKQIKPEAYSHLISIYEAEKSWEQAIESAERLRRSGADGGKDRISHYYCELAEQAIDRKNYAHAREMLSKAKPDNTSAALRVSALAGDINLKCDKVIEAEEHYFRAFEKYPEYAKFLLPKMRKALKHLSVSEFPDYLKRLNPKTVSASYLTAYCQALLDAGRADEAENLFFKLIEQHCIPLSLLRSYLEYKKKIGAADNALIAGVIQSLLANEHVKHSYQCSNCGFKAHHLYWQCPSCHRWGEAQPRDIVKPVSGNATATPVAQASKG